MNVISTETIKEKYARGRGGVVKAGVIARLEKYWKSLHVPATLHPFLRDSRGWVTREPESVHKD